MDTTRTPQAGTAASRVARLPWSEGATTSIMAVLLVLLLDSEALTLYPLATQLAAEYSLTPAQGSFALSITGIFGAAFVPVISRLGDIVGMRRMLLISLIFVAIGNILQAVAQGPTFLLVGRALVGVNAALPLLYALLRLRSTDEDGVDKRSGLMTAAIGGGFAIAFLFGGLVLELGGSVRTVLEILTGFSVALVLLAWLFVQDSDVRTRVSVDWVGAVLMGTGLACFVLALGQGNNWGWTSGRLLGLLVVSILAFGIWGRWELRAPAPLIDLRIIGRREIWPAFAVIGVASVLGNVAILTTSNFVQTPSRFGYGFDGTVLHAGVSLIPLGIAMAIGGTFLAPVIKRIGQKQSAIIGSLLAAASCFWYAGNHDSRWQTAVMMFLVGMSYAMTLTAANSAYLRVARRGEGGMLAGAGRISQQGISALGPAIVVAILTSTVIPGTHVPEESNYDSVWVCLGIFGLVALLFSMLLRNSGLDNSFAPKSGVLGEDV